MTPQQVLLAAAAYIEKNGWRQDGYGPNSVVTPWDEHNVGLPACASNAIAWCDSINTGKPEDEARFLLLEYLGHNRDDGIARIFEWNDAPGRTKAEVLAALRSAAGEEQARAALGNRDLRETPDWRGIKP